MRAVARLLAKEIARRMAQREATRNLLIFAPLIPAVLVVVLIATVSLFVFIMVAEQNAGGCGLSVPIAPPGSNVKTAVAVVQYFESQGISANGAAGITGNLQQESGLNPAAAGGGLAQWLGSRWTALAAYDASLNLDPNSMSGQLVFIVYDLRTNYAYLLTALNSAQNPAQAATMFETAYEICSGVVGWMQVTPGSLCNDTARRTYAVTYLAAAGGGTNLPVSGGTCVGIGGGGGDPIPGFTASRDDMGVDACAQPGMPIYAPAASVLIDVVPNWWKGQPLLLFQFLPSLAGTYLNDQYWFVAEQIIPTTTVIGTGFNTGQQVATYAPSGTCIEIGWGSPKTGSRTLVPGDNNPPPYTLTPEAEAFKVYFHIPWVGISP